MNKSSLLSPQLQQDIENWTKKYPPERRQSALLPALSLAQESNQGWLSQDLIDAVADFLNVARVTAYEVVSFYSLYERAPIGQHKISVCTNISCMLRGCDASVRRLKERLQIDFNQTTADGKFTLKEVECLGACVNAPVLQIGKRYYEEMTPERIDELLDSLNGQ